MTNDDIDKHPGDYDPVTPFNIAQQIVGRVENALSTLSSREIDIVSELNQVALGIQTGDREMRAWWHGDTPSKQGNMEYTCDAELGAPGPADCSQVAYSQLGYPSDTVSVGPDSPKLLSISKEAFPMSSTICVEYVLANEADQVVARFRFSLPFM